MSSTKAISMALQVESLLSSFKKVPSSAVPSIIDCIVSLTASSPSSLFSSLLSSFPNFTEEKWDSDSSGFIASYVVGLCHLLKKPGNSRDALQSFIWKCFIPLMKMLHGHDREILNQIEESFFDAVIATNNWMVVEETMVPFFLRLVGLSVGILQSDKSSIYQWSKVIAFPGLNDQTYDSVMDKESVMFSSEAFPLSMTCHTLTSILDAALQSIQTLQSMSTSIMANGCCYAEKFIGNFLWDLCNMSIYMLSQTLEHRFHAISTLLPVIFKAFVSQGSFVVVLNGQKCSLSRTTLFTKIWNCCRHLFPLGAIERRDAYSLLSLCFSNFSCIKGFQDVTDDGVEGSDMMAEKEFWDELRRGLVDKEGLLRKQSLHILKASLGIIGGTQNGTGVLEKESHQKTKVSRGMTKRDVWADKEAKSLGVGKVYSQVDPSSDGRQRWEAFVLLYEMLEEYGTHLVEAAWDHQMTLLLQFSFPHDKFASCEFNNVQTKTSGNMFDWFAVLWERGLCHDNPQVRCLIMQSFLGIDWSTQGSDVNLVPESFILGPFMRALNDPVHHKEFGVKGLYSSRTIEEAANFVRQYCSCRDTRKGIPFLSKIASVAKEECFGRAGLMSLATCVASAACGVKTEADGNSVNNIFTDFDEVETAVESTYCHDTTNLLEILRFIIESSKQHFNPKYRLQVCEKVLDASAMVVCSSDVPLGILLNFVSTIPEEFTGFDGLLRLKLQEWLLGRRNMHAHADTCNTQEKFLKNLYDFPKRFISYTYLGDAFLTCECDDEELDAWVMEAQKWARTCFLVIKEAHQYEPILKFIQSHGTEICKGENHVGWIPMKFLVLVLSLVQELQMMRDKTTDCCTQIGTSSPYSVVNGLSMPDASVIVEKFGNSFMVILEELVSFSDSSCSILWSNDVMEDKSLPSSVRGKLGGPTQRWLPSSTTTAVLQAITSIRAVAYISSWYAQFKRDGLLSQTFKFLWRLSWKIISTPWLGSETQMKAEVCLAAYEALAPALKASLLDVSPSVLDIIKENKEHSPVTFEGKGMLDCIVHSFIQNINNLLSLGALTRSRRAVLMNWKWMCLESLLSTPFNALKNGYHLENTIFFSEATLSCVFDDLVESLENAGEGSVLPMLRSVRLLLELLSSRRLCTVALSPTASSDDAGTQMMWKLVHSAWLLHISCNKRRVAPIAALLSSVLHSSVFGQESMHKNGNLPGPLKWFIQNILEEGTKSPRTIRLVALHLTGLWLSNPKTIKHYMKELKLLSLHGSVAFDEDFEAELSDNHDARNEVSLLAKSPDPELTEEFINTELYARVSVAVLFYKLADLAEIKASTNGNEDFVAATESGKLFLLELLDSAVNDKDLAKELYKKHSAIHRRKVRAWQIICILSRFTEEDILPQITSSLHICLYRNNLPSVRQYLETFAVQIYLKFPHLVGEQLVPIFQDYDMRPQALSSYVFIAANVILHANKSVQFGHLDELLPPIIPLLTSHHHSLRGFTQLLVYQILCKLWPVFGMSDTAITALEKRCFEDLKLYLEKNSDCVRLRASMGGYLDALNPRSLTTPAGIFTSRVEELDFECIPTSLMEQVINFLNVVREDLRSSMAKDAVALKNESLKMDLDAKMNENSGHCEKKTSHKPLSEDPSWDFQRKITVAKDERLDANTNPLIGEKESLRTLLGIENEDELLRKLVQSRIALRSIRANRQQFILVASFLDRIPNLAGLARTCEVFKATGLAVADANIVHDKQFQLISVTAEKWVPIIEVPVNSVKVYLEKKKKEGFSILGLEQTANSISLDRYNFPRRTVLVVGREKEGIPVDIIHILDACVEIPQLGVVRSLNVHVSGAIALWEYTRQQRSQ